MSKIIKQSAVLLTSIFSQLNHYLMQTCLQTFKFYFQMLTTKMLLFISLIFPFPLRYTVLCESTCCSTWKLKFVTDAEFHM